MVCHFVRNSHKVMMIAFIVILSSSCLLWRVLCNFIDTEMLNLSTILYSSSSISLLLVAGVVAFKDDRCKVTLSTAAACSLWIQNPSSTFPIVSDSICCYLWWSDTFVSDSRKVMMIALIVMLPSNCLLWRFQCNFIDL